MAVGSNPLRHQSRLLNVLVAVSPFFQGKRIAAVHQPGIFKTDGIISHQDGEHQKQGSKEACENPVCPAADRAFHFRIAQGILFAVDEAVERSSVEQQCDIAGKKQRERKTENLSAEGGGIEHLRIEFSGAEEVQEQADK